MNREYDIAEHEVRIDPGQLGSVRTGNRVEFLPLAELKEEEQRRVHEATAKVNRSLLRAVAADTGGKLGALPTYQRISCGWGANPGKVSTLWVNCSIGNYYCSLTIDDAGGSINVSGSYGKETPVPAVQLD